MADRLQLKEASLNVQKQQLAAITENRGWAKFACWFERVKKEWFEENQWIFGTETLKINERFKMEPIVVPNDD